MKQFIIFAALCLLSLSTKAQVQTVQVTNNTTVPVYFMLYGDLSTAGCSSGYNSPVLSVPASSSLTYDATSFYIPSALSSSDNIVGVYLYTNDAGCAPNFSPLGDACFSSNTTYTTVYPIHDNVCNSIGTVNDVTWANMGTFATLVFN